MARYFFHVHDGTDYRDNTGMELPNLASARAHAAKYAGQLLQFSPEAFWTGDKWQMEVTDEKGLVLFSLMFVAFDSPAAQAAGRS